MQEKLEKVYKLSREKQHNYIHRGFGRNVLFTIYVIASGTLLIYFSFQKSEAKCLLCLLLD